MATDLAWKSSGSAIAFEPLVWIPIMVAILLRFWRICLNYSLDFTKLEAIVNNVDFNNPF